MDIGRQSKLIDDMVNENPDYTIRNFLDLREEIEQIEASFQPEPVKRLNSTQLLEAINNTLSKTA